VACPPHDLGGGTGVIADQPEEEVVVGHEGTIAGGADDALTVR